MLLSLRVNVANSYGLEKEMISICINCLAVYVNH